MASQNTFPMASIPNTPLLIPVAPRSIPPMTPVPQSALLLAPIPQNASPPALMASQSALLVVLMPSTINDPLEMPPVHLSLGFLISGTSKCINREHL